MGRGKNNNNRRRATLDGPPPDFSTFKGSIAPPQGFGVGNQQLSCSRAHHNNHNHNHMSCNCNNPNCKNKNLPGVIQANNTLPTNPQEIHDAIEFHWKNLSLDLKNFLLKNPQELSLKKFVEYWTRPSKIENTSPNIAASICGCSWYLALNYMSLGCIVEARALILNGCFLQQCYVSIYFEHMMCIFFWNLNFKLCSSKYCFIVYLCLRRINPLKKLQP